ncbi:hypothetical protein PILCRDRAFT_815121 [Piloderma croceum F 1598]|uniref:Piwi domain-containing protein n=1 Tax=Piloderma croceum (strain F 1598) TaxID=765440 RepID=A0A0C3GAB1_PILCF|nr:hypothetical protein PILCRDRAFT_815121 [Piloderma croceum F 1598]
MSVPTRRRGTVGRPLSVTTNSFKVDTLPRKQFYQYDVITPEPRHPRHAQEIVDRLQSHTAPDVFRPKALYDGQAIMFASRVLNLAGGGSGNFNVFMSDRPPPPGASGRGVYSVKLTRAAAQVIDFTALADLITGKGGSSPRTLTAINILQLLIRAAPNLMYPHTLRAYYTSAGKSNHIGGGLELWRGFFQSVRPCVGQMLINVDVSVSAMYRSGTLQEVALSVLGSNNMRDLTAPENHANLKKLKNFFKNVLVMVTPTGGRPNERSRKKKIRGLVANAGEFEFEKDGGQTTVKDHFKEAHGYMLQHPLIFGILVGSKERAIVFPAEVCTVVEGQIYKKKVPQELTSHVVKFATSKPEDRLRTIKQGSGMRAPIFEYETSPFMQDAGMRVSPAPVRIDGRVLPTPKLVFGDNEAMRIQNGGWNVTKNKFKEPMPLIAWAVIDYARNHHKAQSFIDMLLRCFQVLEYLQPYTSAVNGQGNISGDLMNVAHATMDWAGQQAMQLPPDQRPPKPSRIALIICILPYPAAEIRRAVKHFGDVESGIPTQCIRVDKIKEGNHLNQYCNNVALKINARLGGLNSVTSSRALAELQQNKFMIFGADVGHPGAGMKNQPSVASMVWSFDNHAMKYAAFSSVQEPRQEHIEELGSMMTRALDAYGEMWKAAPARLVLFRDGLSEGEFEGVGAREIEAIEGAINEIWTLRKLTVPKPKLTYIVVGKRHHVRFFPDSGTGDKSGNCPPGFVADSGIDSPLAADFYILSHGGLLGTSRPSHYTVLRDDIFSNNPDALQELAYTLCHCYAKATRSVSIPAPVYCKLLLFFQVVILIRILTDADVSQCPISLRRLTTCPQLVCARANFHFSQDLRYDDASSANSGDAGFDLKPWKDGYKPLHAGLRKSMYFL